MAALFFLIIMKYGALETTNNLPPSCWALDAASSWWSAKGVGLDATCSIEFVVICSNRRNGRMCYLMGHLSEFGLVFSLQFAWRFVDLLVVQYRMHVGLESHELGGVTAVITTWISKRENVMRALLLAIMKANLESCCWTIGRLKCLLFWACAAEWAAVDRKVSIKSSKWQPTSRWPWSPVHPPHSSKVL